MSSIPRLFLVPWLASLLASTALAQTCISPPSGLIGWWPGDDSALETVGARDGTLVNAPTFAAGLVGRAFNLDGVNDYISLPGTWGGGAETTVCAWFNVSATNAVDFEAVVGSSNINDHFVHLQLYHLGNLAVFVNTGTIAFPAISQSPTGVWRHVAVSVKSGDTNLYLDGSLIGTNNLAFSSTVPTTTLRIGSGHAGARFFNGQIDEVQIFDRALAASEIQAIYGAGSGGLCRLPPIGLPFCFGDGSNGNCPCTNLGAGGRGCGNSVNAIGALLEASGTTNPDTVVLSASAMPAVATIASVFLQGDFSPASPITFGDGLRCADGGLIRLGSKPMPAGSARYPETGNLPVSVRGGVIPGGGATRYYQTYYRNSSAAFCPPETFNVTQGVQLVW